MSIPDVKSWARGNWLSNGSKGEETVILSPLLRAGRCVLVMTEWKGSLGWVTGVGAKCQRAFAVGEQSEMQPMQEPKTVK
jgi:hypothetical protein